ncbi:MAG: D-alanine--D-alanine ligase [Pseudomonadota bacterium]|jgi:D-alanine-D-alanine ligase
MAEDKKIKVAVLYGGCSAEHEVSLLSAAAVIKNLDKNKFTIIPMGIDKQGCCFINELQRVYHDDEILLKTENSECLRSLAELGTQHRPDIIFPVLHGTLGEDGTIQGLFEVLDLAYVGADVLGSAIGMDKDVAKRLATAAEIPVVPFVSIDSGLWTIKKDELLQNIEREIGYPLFVKPANIGSSLGITKVKKSNDLVAAIELAFTYSTKLLLEKAFEVREIEMAVLENLRWGAEPLVSKAGEIIPSHEFYSYEAKYLDPKGAELMIPATLQQGQLQQLKQLAIKIFDCLACSGMARIDFFIEKQSQQIYFNELNTIPGFTKISMYPKLWEASGLSYQQLLTQLIELGMARHQRLSLLKRSI